MGLGAKASPSLSTWDPRAEVRCVHVETCGACPLMPKRYEDQRGAKLERIRHALGRYAMKPVGSLAPVLGAETLTAYRRRAKLVVASEPGGGGVAVGLYRRADNQSVVDIPQCQVLSPALMKLVATLRELAAAPPAELACLLEPVTGTSGVLAGLDARELVPGRGAGDDGEGDDDGASGEGPQVLLTLLLAAERAAPTDQLREAARELRRRMPEVAGVSVSLRYGARPQAQAELVTLSGASESRDRVAAGYQLVSHTSFLHGHRGQAERLYELIVRVVGEAVGGKAEGAEERRAPRVLDLYGGTGAIAVSLALAGFPSTLVESYPPAAALAQRAAQAQRLPIEVVTGDVASVTKALAAAGSRYDVVVANPPRRGLSPAARESAVALGARAIVYVACDLDNLCRDLDHMARLGYRLRDLYPLDMLPLTEEIEAVAVLEPAPPPPVAVLHRDADIVVLDKPPYEPLQDQPEYPSSLVARARREGEMGDWVTVLKIEPGTSGVTILARDQQAADKWTRALADNGRLVYLAAARGVTPAKGAITRELRGEDGPKPARTRYRRLAIGGGHSVLRVVPEKRYVHQIRRHLAAIGHPVLGDARYGHAPTNRYFEEKHGLDRSFLHLVRVEVDHPDTGERLLVESPLPPDLRAALVRASDESVLRFLENKHALGRAGLVVREGPASFPSSERSPLSIGDFDPESAYPSQRMPATQRLVRGPLDLDEAPRTVRGELLTPGDEDEG
jgi:23S rRNA (uracil1939-C5)-methyltransferase